MADTFGEIHEVHKGLWAFFLDFAFWMLIGWAGKLRSHGSSTRQNDKENNVLLCFQLFLLFRTISKEIIRKLVICRLVWNHIFLYLSLLKWSIDKVLVVKLTSSFKFPIVSTLLSPTFIFRMSVRMAAF